MFSKVSSCEVQSSHLEWKPPSFWQIPCISTAVTVSTKSFSALTAYFKAPWTIPPVSTKWTNQNTWLSISRGREGEMPSADSFKVHTMHESSLRIRKQWIEIYHFIRSGNWSALCSTSTGGSSRGPGGRTPANYIIDCIIVQLWITPWSSLSPHCSSSLDHCRFSRHQMAIPHLGTVRPKWVYNGHSLKSALFWPFSPLLPVQVLWLDPACSVFALPMPSQQGLNKRELHHEQFPRNSPICYFWSELPSVEVTRVMMHHFDLCRGDRTSLNGEAIKKK